MSELQDNNVITYYEEKEKYYRLNTDEESVNTCMDYMLNDFTFAKTIGSTGVDESDAGDGYRSFCEGTGTISGNTLKVHMENGFNVQNGYFVTQSDVDSFVANGVLTEIEPTVGLAITDYDIDTCGPDVVIPSKINGVNVISIADAIEESASSYYGNDNYTNTLEFRNDNYNLEKTFSGSNNSFNGYGITSVVFPNTLLYIGERAFQYNYLTDVEIPDSVTEIGARAFYSETLDTANVKGASILGKRSFYNSNWETMTLFQYGGTCEQLLSYSPFSNWPETVITSNNNACIMVEESPT